MKIPGDHGPGGEIIGRQNKIHPFDYEKRPVSPGKDPQDFQNRVQVRVLICYDTVFSDVARKMAENSAEVLISPSRIVRRGYPPWHMCVQVRSLENSIPGAAANVRDRGLAAGT